MAGGNGKNGNARSSGVRPQTSSPACSTIRCAIYTRKSTDENLDSDFNSLDAQREACELYIRAQANGGWIVLPERYDDGAYSGATLERPAVQRLLRDVEAGRIDLIVVYRIDRLSRNLLDFTQTLHDLEQRGCSFVSVSEQFNTKTPMGRFAMHVVSSFSEMEREVIAERIRDKVAASKRRGMWMGGVPPLGYDVDFEKKRLLVNPEEAEWVRRIFLRFLELGSGVKLIRELNADGHRTKSWTTKKGRRREGRPFNLGHLYRVLNNPLYVGLVRHREQTYSGEHEAIVDQTLWDAVRERLKSRGLCEDAARFKTPALLRGIIRCGHCGSAMGITYSRKGSRSYRYYLCVSAAKSGYDACAVRSVPAGDVEAAVVLRLRTLFRKDAAGMDGVDAVTVAVLRKLDGLWDELFPVERERIVRLLLESVILRADGLELEVRKDGLAALAYEMSSDECHMSDEKTHGKRRSETVTFTIPMRFKRKSGRKEIVLPPGDHPPTLHSTAIQKPLAVSLARAHRWRELLDNGRFHSIGELAEEIGTDRAYIGRLLNLTLLAPDIIDEILDGREPSGLSLEKLTRNTPFSWDEQRRRFGFQSK
jgi:DNA invertase Pin-like site-specific DNA recombinase